jgi:hypothetical protein
MENLLIKDGFVWRVLTPEEISEAEKVFDESPYTFFKIDQYGGELACEYETDLITDGTGDDKICIAVGDLKDLQDEFEEGEANRFRNNDTTSFEDWLQDKVDNIY